MTFWQWRGLFTDNSLGISYWEETKRKKNHLSLLCHRTVFSSFAPFLFGGEKKLNGCTEMAELTTWRLQQDHFSFLFIFFPLFQFQHFSFSFLFFRMHQATKPRLRLPLKSSMDLHTCLALSTPWRCLENKPNSLPTLSNQVIPFFFPFYVMWSLFPFLVMWCDVFRGWTRAWAFHWAFHCFFPFLHQLRCGFTSCFTLCPKRMCQKKNKLLHKGRL